MVRGQLQTIGWQHREQPVAQSKVLFTRAQNLKAIDTRGALSDVSLLRSTQSVVSCRHGSYGWYHLPNRVEFIRQPTEYGGYVIRELSLCFCEPLKTNHLYTRKTNKIEAIRGRAKFYIRVVNVILIWFRMVW